MSDSLLGWHFVGETLRDGRPIPADGEVLRHVGEIVPCRSGLHGSERLIDALQYAPDVPNLKVCRAEFRGEIVHHRGDKFAARERVYLWRVDADPILREFARWCALEVVHLWDAPDVVREYLKTGNPSIRAAVSDAASDAVRAAARDAARDAAWATAWDEQNAKLTEMVERFHAETTR